MEDAVRAFDAGAYLSAISLALTIPDVCGGRISPGKGSRERYESWFDEYVSPSYVEPAEYNKHSSDPDCTSQLRCYFTGADCYQLRCVYLHEGSNAPHIDKGKTVLDLIQFRLFDPDVCECDHVGETWYGIDGQAFRQINLDLQRFIRLMSEGVKRFVSEHPDMNDDKGLNSTFYQPLLDFRNVIMSDK